MLFPTSGRVSPREAYNPECFAPIVKHGGRSEMVWAAISWYSILLAPLLPFMAKLLQGSIYMDRLGNQVHPTIQTSMHFSKMTMPPFTQLELFSHGLKSVKVNFNSPLASTITTFEHH
jgi:hypothetical protein